MHLLFLMSKMKSSDYDTNQSQYSIDAIIEAFALYTVLERNNYKNQVIFSRYQTVMSFYDSDKNYSTSISASRNPFQKASPQIFSKNHLQDNVRYNPTTEGSSYGFGTASNLNKTSSVGYFGGSAANGNQRNNLLSNSPFTSNSNPFAVSTAKYSPQLSAVSSYSQNNYLSTSAANYSPNGYQQKSNNYLNSSEVGGSYGRHSTQQYSVSGEPKKYEYFQQKDKYDTNTYRKSQFQSEMQVGLERARENQIDQKYKIGTEEKDIKQFLSKNPFNKSGSIVGSRNRSDSANKHSHQQQYGGYSKNYDDLVYRGSQTHDKFRDKTLSSFGNEEAYSQERSYNGYLATSQVNAVAGFRGRVEDEYPKESTSHGEEYKLSSAQRSRIDSRQYGSHVSEKESSSKNTLINGVQFQSATEGSSLANGNGRSKGQSYRNSSALKGYLDEQSDNRISEEESLFYDKKSQASQISNPFKRESQIFSHNNTSFQSREEKLTSQHSMSSGGEGVRRIFEFQSFYSSSDSEAYQNKYAKDKQRSEKSRNMDQASSNGRQSDKKYEKFMFKKKPREELLSEEQSIASENHRSLSKAESSKVDTTVQRAPEKIHDQFEENNKLIERFLQMENQKKVSKAQSEHPSAQNSKQLKAESFSKIIISQREVSDIQSQKALNESWNSEQGRSSNYKKRKRIFSPSSDAESSQVSQGYGPGENSEKRIDEKLEQFRYSYKKSESNFKGGQVEEVVQMREESLKNFKKKSHGTTSELEIKQVQNSGQKSQKDSVQHERVGLNLYSSSQKTQSNFVEQSQRMSDFEDINSQSSEKKNSMKTDKLTQGPSVESDVEEYKGNFTKKTEKKVPTLTSNQIEIHIESANTSKSISNRELTKEKKEKQLRASEQHKGTDEHIGDELNQNQVSQKGVNNTADYQFIDIEDYEKQYNNRDYNFSDDEFEEQERELEHQEGVEPEVKRADGLVLVPEYGYTDHGLGNKQSEKPRKNPLYEDVTSSSQDNYENVPQFGRAPSSFTRKRPSSIQEKVKRMKIYESDTNSDAYRDSGDYQNYGLADQSLKSSNKQFHQDIDDSRGEGEVVIKSPFQRKISNESANHNRPGILKNSKASRASKTSKTIHEESDQNWESYIEKQTYNSQRTIIDAVAEKNFISSSDNENEEASESEDLKSTKKNSFARQQTTVSTRNARNEQQYFRKQNQLPTIIENSKLSSTSREESEALNQRISYIRSSSDGMTVQEISKIVDSSFQNDREPPRFGGLAKPQQKNQYSSQVRSRHKAQPDPQKGNLSFEVNPSSRLNVIKSKPPGRIELRGMIYHKVEFLSN